MDINWIIVIFIGLIDLQPSSGHVENVQVRLIMPKYAERGSSITLQCKHNVEPQVLFKVAWIKAETGKFFEFIRGRNPPFRNFSVDGAKIDFENSNATQVTLKNIDFAAYGTYFCEVSTDLPIFTKASLESLLHIFIPQTAPPTIKLRKRTPFLIGERILALCNTTKARPAPHITWLINGKKVDDKFVRTQHTSMMMPKSSHRKSQQQQQQHHYEHEYLHPQQYHLSGPDRYDKSLRIASGGNWRADDIFKTFHHHPKSMHNNPFGSLANIHKISHKSYDNKYGEARKHKGSSNHKNRRSSGLNLLTLRTNNGGASASGSMASIYNALSGSADFQLRSTHTPPHTTTADPLARGLFAISQLSVEVNELHIDNNSRLEITCLATIPSHVELGEQYADYKTYSVKVEIERPETSSATPTPSIGMAALGNGSFASSIHTWPVKILLFCLVFLRI